MEIGLSKARADIKESRLLTLQAIVFDGKRQLRKFYLALFVGPTNVFINILSDRQKCGKGTARYFTISKRRFAFILPGFTRFQIDLFVFSLLFVFSVVPDDLKIVSHRPQELGTSVDFLVHVLDLLLEFVVGQY